MKTKFLVAVIGSCFALPALPALAESNVSVYGIADAGVMWQKGGPTKIISGGADGSRIGFKGSEDIGNGFKAIFNLEARVELDTGKQQPTLVNENQGYYLTRGMDQLAPPPLGPALQARLRVALQPPGAPAVNPENALFDRTAMVGLITPVGALLLGRMYTPGYEVFASADTFETGTAGSWGHVISGTAGFTAVGADIRSPKAVQYRIALPSGWGGSLMYGFRNSGYLSRYDRFRAAAVTYKARGFDVGAAINQGHTLDGRPSLRTRTIGGSYLTGNFKLFAGYLDQKNDNSPLLNDYIAGWDTQVAPVLPTLGVPAAALPVLRAGFINDITLNTKQDARSWQVGLHYRIGAGRLMVSYAHQDDRIDSSDSDADQYAIGYMYNLSKRTDIYTVAAYINNKNFAQYSPGTAGAPGGFTDGPGENGQAFQIGVRHRF